MRICAEVSGHEEYSVFPTKHGSKYMGILERQLYAY